LAKTLGLERPLKKNKEKGDAALKSLIEVLAEYLAAKTSEKSAATAKPADATPAQPADTTPAVVVGASQNTSPPAPASAEALLMLPERAHHNSHAVRAASSKAPASNCKSVSGDIVLEEVEDLDDAEDAGEDEWKFNFSAAVEDVRVSYSETVVALAMLNRYGLDEWARNALNVSDDDHAVSDLHIPAVVVNHKKDSRRASAEDMLRAVGFRDITIQPAIEIETLDLAALENSGRVSSNWDYIVKETMGWKDVSNVRKMRYIAHALDFQDVIERHISSAADFSGVSSWIAVFEDDIVLTTSPVNAHKRLVEAVSSLPRNAHVLYVEWCFDICGESRLNTQYPLISLASRPHCSAGILFSAQGARKLKTLLRPIDSTIDDMLASLCHRRAIYCYKLRLPIFTQDKKWGSNVDEERQVRMLNANSKST
jgi:hypothetical protein